MLLEVSALLVVAVLVGLAARRIRVPLSVVLATLGFAAAALGLSPQVGRLEGETFEQVVVFLFLPVLVFAAALGLDLRAFARNLGALGLPILLWDERWSTQAVTRTLIDADASRARRADLVDKMAAAYILQGAIDALTWAEPQSR